MTVYKTFARIAFLISMIGLLEQEKVMVSQLSLNQIYSFIQSNNLRSLRLKTQFIKITAIELINMLLINFFSDIEFINCCKLIKNFKNILR